MDIPLFLEQLPSMPLIQVVAISLWVNLALCAGSILFYVVVHQLAASKKLLAPYQVLTLSDIGQVLLTVVCNALIFVLGVYLWKYHVLQISFQASYPTIIGQVVLILLAMDLLMYIFHRLAHWSIIYPFIHRKHHDHIRVNALSLFVLSPFEALGFGLFLIAVLGCFSFSYQAIIIYLSINLLWGTIGHFNIEFFPSLNNHRIGKWIGTASFHNTHHQQPKSNYGFYTTLWDKVAGTFRR
ncbi:sterol desaturase family protein [Myroides pelagicus]|uniref:sterol desaturase family protein n=1 Tax=Myroides pelagicus TaxID=270914 RepID=UPI002DBB5005|nr:sterol desaturase family protein [Myroides pelagicus]